MTRSTLRQQAHTLARLQYECDLTRLDHPDDHDYVIEMESVIEKFKNEHPAALLWMYGTQAERDRIDRGGRHE